MSRIVAQLLLVARLETLNIRVDEQVDLASVACEAAENLGPIAVSTGKILEVEAPPGPVFIRGNGSVVVAAVGSLIENALNHSPPRRGRSHSDNAGALARNLRFWAGHTSRIARKDL
jgi:signal transduction histidine kinase